MSKNCKSKTEYFNPYKKECIPKKDSHSIKTNCRWDQAKNIITQECVDVYDYSKHIHKLCDMLGIDVCNPYDIYKSLKDTTPMRIMDLVNPNISDKVGYYDVQHREFQNMFHSYNCHIGQLKLFYTLFEFLVICHTQNIDLGNSIVLYIGAAPGDNIYAVSKFFPEVIFALYDPRLFSKNLLQDDRFIINSEDKGWFKLDTCDDVIKLAKRIGKKNILYISDIRVDTNEDNIKKDMLLQQETVFRLKPLAYMLKFRLPYVKPGDDTFLDYNLPSNYSTIINSMTTKKDPLRLFHYLAGDIYLQLYPPVRSTETRLIGFRRKIDGEVSSRGKYFMTTYDVQKYENMLNAYNMSIRPLRSVEDNAFAKIAKVKDVEQLNELFIWDKYLTLFNKDYSSYDDNKKVTLIQEKMKEMDTMLNITASKRRHCKVNTTIKHKAKHAIKQK